MTISKAISPFEVGGRINLLKMSTKVKNGTKRNNQKLNSKFKSLFIKKIG